MCHNSQVAIIVEISSYLPIAVLPKVQRKCVSDVVEAISGVSYFQNSSLLQSLI